MSASPPGAAANEEASILFRPSKKRKIYRQRAVNDEDGDETEGLRLQAARVTEGGTGTAAQSLDELIASASNEGRGIADAGESGGDARVEGVTVSMAEILRLRRKNKRAGGGVEFKSQASGTGAGPSLRDEDGNGDTDAHDGTAEEVGGLDVARRFAAQTGAVGDVNKHM
jgi:hypothetical protein